MCRAPLPTCPTTAVSIPEAGVNLTYFVDDRGFARPTAPMPGEGPTWISGLVVLKDKQGASGCSRFTPRSARCSKSTSAGSLS